MIPVADYMENEDVHIESRKVEATIKEDGTVMRPAYHAIDLTIKDASYADLYWPVREKIEEILGADNNDIEIGITNSNEQESASINLTVKHPPKGSFAESSGQQREMVEKRVQDIVELLQSKKSELTHAIALSHRQKHLQDEQSTPSTWAGRMREKAASAAKAIRE